MGLAARLVAKEPSASSEGYDRCGRATGIPASATTWRRMLMNTARFASVKNASSFFIRAERDTGRRAPPTSRTNTISHPRSGITTNRRTPRCRKTSDFSCAFQATTLRPPHFPKGVRMPAYTPIKQAGRRQKRLVLHLVLDQEHQGEGKAQRASGVAEHGQRDVHVQPGGLQSRHQGMCFGAQ